jgi:hypothetical protein
MSLRVVRINSTLIGIKRGEKTVAGTRGLSQIKNNQKEINNQKKKEERRRKRRREKKEKPRLMLLLSRRTVHSSMDP